MQNTSNLSNKKTNDNYQIKQYQCLDHYKQQFDKLANVCKYKHSCQRFLNNIKENFYLQAMNHMNKQQK